MKLFASLMACLVLVLSLLPCADARAVDKGKWSTEVTSNHQQQSDHPDECSPFCHCTCCASFSINHYIAFVTVVPSFLNTPAIAYLPSAIMEVSLPVWQPPQLKA